MKHLLLFAFFFSVSVSAEWGMELKGNENVKSIRLGVRLQGVAEYYSNETQEREEFDFYARRMRLQVETNFYKDWKTYFDIRNDNSTEDFRGEGEFLLGDGYLQIPISESMKIRFFRSKVDMSYSQTASSANLIYLERSAVSDYASNYVSESRRANNIQLNGRLMGEDLSYQLVLGDGIEDDDFRDGEGNLANEVISQGPMMGYKIRYYLMGDNPGRIRESSLGEDRYFSLGLGQFLTSNIAYKATGADSISKIDRQLVNLELAYKNSSVTFLAEYFHFDGEVNDFNFNKKGTSEGWYLMIDYFFQSKHSIFIRHEDWDKFSNDPNHNYRANLIGYNYYLEGNKIRFGVAYTETSEIKGNTITNTDKIQTNLMLHY